MNSKHQNNGLIVISVTEKNFLSLDSVFRKQPYYLLYHAKIKNG